FRSVWWFGGGSDGANLPDANAYLANLGTMHDQLIAAFGAQLVLIPYLPNLLLVGAFPFVQIVRDATLAYKVSRPTTVRIFNLDSQALEDDRHYGSAAMIYGGEGPPTGGGGVYTLAAVDDGTHITLTNTGAAGNAAPGSTVGFPTGTPTSIALSHMVGGALGALNTFSATTASYVQPAASANVTVAVADSSLFSGIAIGSSIYAGDVPVLNAIRSI